MSVGFTIYVLDDDEDLRESLQVFLADEGFKVKTYASVLDFLSDGEAKEPGCAVADLRMPGMDGLEFLSHPKVRSRGLPVILMTAYATVPLAVRAMKLGAADILEKPFSGEELLGALNGSLGRANSQYGEDHSIPEELAARLASLSQREVDVLRLLLDGQSNKIIARELGISPRTVEVHRARVMRKTHADSLPELIQTCLIANDLRPALKARAEFTFEAPQPAVPPVRGHPNRATCPRTPLLRLGEGQFHAEARGFAGSSPQVALDKSALRSAKANCRAPPSAPVVLCRDY